MHKRLSLLLLPLMVFGFPGISRPGFLVLPVHAEDSQTIEQDGILYTITGEATVKVAEGNDASGDIEIPASITSENKTYAVTELDKNAFIGCTELTGITLPSGLTRIGANAFSMCYSLQEIDLPDSVTHISDNAFANCISLSKVIFPANLEVIGNSAFDGCSSLVSIQIPASCQTVSDYAFFNCPSLETVVFDSSDVTLGNNAIPSSAEIFGINNWTPTFLETYSSQYQGTYEGENLNARAATGWVQIGDELAFINEDGSYATNTWQIIDGVEYHFNREGLMDTGWKNISNVMYYFQPDGRMTVWDWVQDGDQWFFFDGEGHMLANTWITWFGEEYYFGSDGAMVKGRIIPYKGICYYVGSDGTMVTSQTINCYHIDANGIVTNQFMLMPNKDGDTCILEDVSACISTSPLPEETDEFLMK